MFDLWSTYWFRSRFSSSTSVSPTNFHSTKYNSLLINLSSMLCNPDTHSIVKQPTEEKQIIYNIYILCCPFFGNTYSFPLHGSVATRRCLPILGAQNQSLPETAAFCYRDTSCLHLQRKAITHFTRPQIGTDSSVSFRKAIPTHLCTYNTNMAVVVISV
jgi:hypothetical protein